MPNIVHGTLAALADESRQSVDLLSEEPRRASDIAAALGITPQAMSSHLRVLHRVLIRGEGIEDDAPASASTASARNPSRNSASG